MSKILFNLLISKRAVRDFENQTYICTRNDEIKFNSRCKAS